MRETPVSPLTRATVTAASRVMLPTYVATFGIVGVNWLAAPSQRLLASPVLRAADAIMPIRGWGALFAACAVLMAVALVRHHRDLYRFALLVCAVAMSTWSLVAAVGTLFEPVSFSAWVWPACVAVACLASNRSLARHEGPHGRAEPDGNDG